MSSSSSFRVLTDVYLSMFLRFCTSHQAGGRLYVADIHIHCEVLQGAILGPLLFFASVNEIS